MLDINLLRENPEEVKRGIKLKGVDPKIVDRVLKVDETRRQLIGEIEKFRRKRNELSSEVTKGLVKNSSEVKRKRLHEKGEKIKEMLRRLEPDLRAVEDQLKNLLYEIPNLPADDVPIGGEQDSQLMKEVGKPLKFGFRVKDHLELGESLDIIDIKRAAKVSGARFNYLKNEAVLLELALINFGIANLLKKGFTPIFPPMLIKKEITDSLGYWHGGGNENYYFVKDYVRTNGDNGGEERESDLYLVGTGEHAVVPLHMDEVIEGKDLPRKYVAFSSCFRREAGSYGKDTRGILRVHQFDKLEMISIIKPEDDKREHLELLSCAEELMRLLGLPYRIVVLASADIGFPTAKTYDIETWIPSQGKYRETHSISTTTDYQSRRLNIKYRVKGMKSYTYILNGTALAIGRMIIAILENYQQKDGSVIIPTVLQKYTGFKKISPQK